MLTINPPGTAYRHTSARYHLVYARITRSPSLFLSLSFRRSRFALPFYRSRSLSRTRSPLCCVRHKRAACAHTCLSLSRVSLSFCGGPLLLYIHTTIVRSFRSFSHLVSTLDFRPSWVSSSLSHQPKRVALTQPSVSRATPVRRHLLILSSIPSPPSSSLSPSSGPLFLSRHPRHPILDTRYLIMLNASGFCGRIMRPRCPRATPLSRSLPFSLTRSSLTPLSSRSLARAPVRHPVYPSRSHVTAHACLQKGFVAASVSTQNRRKSSTPATLYPSAHFPVPPQFPSLSKHCFSFADYEIMKKGGGEKNGRKRGTTITRT